MGSDQENEVVAALERVGHLLPSGVFYLDAGLVFRQVNPLGAARFGKTQGEIVGRRASEVFGASGYEACLADLWRALAGERVVREGRELDTDRRARIVRTTYAPELLSDGRVLGILVGVEIVDAAATAERLVDSNLTERREVEDPLREAEKMEAVGRLAGGIAHDFNNILSVILSFNALAQMELPPSHEALEHLSEVQKAAERAAGLTTQLLAFSRKQILKPRVLDPNALIREQGPMIRLMLGENVEVSFVLQARGHVRADAGQLGQVLMNLVGNARDALPEGGNLTIATKDVELEGKRAAELQLKPGPYVMIAVSDTGMGMDEATLARVFEPFFSTKGQGRGSGLGLSTVFGIVKQSGGAVAVDSELGGGTTVTFHLPGSSESLPPTPVRERVASPTATGETVLVVEDDDQLRSLVCSVLSRQGYRVIDAADPLIAIEVAGGFPDSIHLLLTDIVMPHMDGGQLARRIVLTRPGTRVLFMSGYTDASIVHRGVIEPGVSFLPKPITPDVLLRMVRRVLDA